jgi:REP element-mobilizing transposase RayT
MPSRNILKEQVADSYYHVYARGGNKQKIFLEAADYKYFLQLFERYISPKPSRSVDGTPYPHFFKHIELLAYCLMSNHFHLLVYQEDVPYLEKFMRSLMTSYSRYFNLKYHRSGPLFESRYKAARIDNDTYLQHITRYIHLNPRLWERYRYSSLRYYRDGHEPVWLCPKPVLAVFETRQDYMNFVSDYEAMREMLSELKHQLAD